jgi:hypothetical protein
VAFSGFQGFGDSPIQQSMMGGYGAPARSNVSQRTQGFANQPRKNIDYASLIGNAAGSLWGGFANRGAPSAPGVNPNFDYGSVGTRVNAPTWGGF